MIGSLFAGHLAEVVDVSLLTRRREHADALNAEGLRITGRSDRHARVTATSDPDELEPFDLGIVATKAAGLEGAAGSLAGRFPEAAIMPVLNGLGADEVIRAHGDWPIVSSVTFISGTKHSDTEVEYVLDTETWLGPYEDTPFTLVQEIADLIVASGLKAEALPDLLPAQWSKLIFNATVNSVAGLTELRHDFHFAAEESPSDLGYLVHDLIDEGKAVAAAAGVDLHDDPVGDERARDAPRSRSLPFDARGSRSPQTDRDRPDHRCARARGRKARRARSPAYGHVPARQGEGGVLVSPAPQFPSRVPGGCNDT